MLAAGPAARAETPFQLGGRDDQVTAADPKAVCRDRQPCSGSGRGQRSHERNPTVNGCFAETTPQLGAHNPSDYGAQDRPDERYRHHGSKETSS